MKYVIIKMIFLRYIIKLEWRFRILPALGNFSESSAIVDIFGELFVAGTNGKISNIFSN